MAIAKAGLENCGFHDLRHSCTTLQSQGGAVKTILESTEHSTTRMTKEVYLHVFDTTCQAAADSMDGVLMQSGILSRNCC